MRYILKSINLLNVLLGGLLVLVLTYGLHPLMGRDIQPDKPSARKITASEEKPQAKDSAADTTDYLVIAERNLFHPERIIPVEKKEEKPLPKPDFVLYGTLIEDSTRLAFMDDMKSQITTPGRGKRQRVIPRGGNLSGYTLREVHEDRIVMARGEDRITVLLSDRHLKKSATAETTASPAASPTASTTQTGTPAKQVSKSPQQTSAPSVEPYRKYQPDTLRRAFKSKKR